jgi:glycosyltransferase involved in cell wall biosynthesis
MPYKPSLASQRVRNEIKTADYVLIPSDFVRDSFQAENELTDKLIQIPFGVDPQRFRPSPQPVSEKPFRALFMGQVSIRKGAHLLLEAWRLLGWQDAELWFVGQNNLEAHILSRYRGLKSVHFLGYVSDPVKIFQRANVFVFPSLLEGSALVTYEALACGLPVITTKNAGSLVTNGLEGFLIPVRDPDAVATCLDQIRRDDNLRKKMGTAARELAEANTWEQYGDRIAQTLRDII